MGRDFKCGCRFSMGHWFLCDKHHTELLAKLVEQEKGEAVVSAKPCSMCKSSFHVEVFRATAPHFNDGVLTFVMSIQRLPMLQRQKWHSRM